MAINITSIKTSSNGAWQGDNPLHFAFPLLIIQTTLVLVLSRSLAFLLKPLRQPKVIAEIAGGILLGPSALGRNKAYLHTLFPSWSLPILESAASIGLLFFLFLVGLELDLASIRRSGKKALGIALAGITLPFVCGVGVAFVLRSAIPGARDVAFGPFLVFMGVALSITAFPVLARILAELKLLTTQVGETAMAAAAFNDVVAWVLLALAVALSGSGVAGAPHKSPLISLWVLLSGVAFVAFVMLAVRPLMAWVARRSSPEDESVDEVCIAVTLAGVLVSGFMTDLIGIHSIFGAFVFGLAIPKEGEFAGRLIERIEDFVSGLLLPLYFASSGLKTDVAKIQGAEAWGLLVLVISTACMGKILGTFAVAVLNRIPAREALTLGLLMNTKGLVELIVLNIGKERKVLNDEMFAILVLMALFTTFMTTPMVMAVYKPACTNDLHYKQRRIQTDSPNEDQKQLRLVACLHGPGNIPSMINLIETIRGTARSPLKLYIMRLVELTERSSSIAMVQRFRRNGLPFWDRLKVGGSSRDRVAAAFEAYGQLGRVRVRPMMAVSALASMHKDICAMAEEKRVAMILVPFHKHGSGTQMENVGHGWRGVNQRLLKEAPCSVGVLIDRGLNQLVIKPGEIVRSICIVFFGGPDDREALELAVRMATHPGVKVRVIRFVKGGKKDVGTVALRPSPEKCVEKSYSFSTAAMDREREMELDEAAVSEFLRKTEGTVDFEEKQVNNVIESVLEIGRSRQYELLVVGRGRFPSAMVAELAERVAEHAELGPIGDILASSTHGVVSSVLVVQQHDLILADLALATKVVGMDTPSPL